MGNLFSSRHAGRLYLLCCCEIQLLLYWCWKYSNCGIVKFFISLFYQLIIMYLYRSSRVLLFTLCIQFSNIFFCFTNRIRCRKTDTAAALNIPEALNHHTSTLQCLPLLMVHSGTCFPCLTESTNDCRISKTSCYIIYLTMLVSYVTLLHYAGKLWYFASLCW